jgi:nucleotide-binding universal stress UspA family protein
MTFRIVVPIDGSDVASNSLTWTIAFAARVGGELLVCSAFDPMLSCVAAAGGALIDPQPMLEWLRADARALGVAAVAQSAAAQISATSDVLEGSAAFSIADFARLRSADLIVLGTHARGGIVLGIAGSVTDDIVCSTSIPVAAVRLGTAGVPGGPIVVAVDGSPAAAVAATFALSLARTSNCPIHLVHIIGDREPAAFAGFAHLALQAAAAGVACTTELRRGECTRGVIAAAHDRGASLIATGTHGRSGIGRLFLGSVAAGLVHASPVPVVIVRRPA